MSNRIVKPTTAARRNMTAADFSMLTVKKAKKSLLSGKKSMAGRGNQGKITTRHRGAGAKRSLRDINFKFQDGTYEIISIEYDPNRSARIALLKDNNGKYSYVLAANKRKVGDKIEVGENTPIEDGNTMSLKNIPVGILVHNIEMRPGQGGIFARSAGNYGIIQAVEGGMVHVKLSSGEIKLLHENCKATLGQIGNVHHGAIKIGKAGRNRYKGKRPTVRGKAMHPAAHPHGGGEGANSIGLKGGPKTKWGAKALGVKTRKRSKKKLRK